MNALELFACPVAQLADSQQGLSYPLCTYCKSKPGRMQCARGRVEYFTSVSGSNGVKQRLAIESETHEKIPQASVEC